MEGLQRSTISFRRQGSSGIVWDDRFLSGELNKAGNDPKEESQRNEQEKAVTERQEQQQGKEKTIADDDVNKVGIKPIRTVGSGGGANGGERRHRTGRVSPAVDPPSPRLSACGCCTAFGKKPNGKKGRQKSGKPPRRSR